MQVRKIYCDGSTKEACVVAGGASCFVRYYAPKTNNQSEYCAVCLACQEARIWARVQLGHGSLEAKILTDSLLVVNQLNGSYRCTNTQLKGWLDTLKSLIKWAFVYDNIRISVEYIPREDNPAGKILEKRR